MNLRLPILFLLLFFPFTFLSAQVIVEPDEEDTEEGAEEIEDYTDEEAEVTEEPADSTFVVGGIDAPEGMNTNIDVLLNEWHSKYIENKESTTLYPSEPILADAEAYTDRLRRLPSGMELPYNEIVKKFIEQYVGRLRRSVSYMLGAQNFYIPIFEEALDAYGLPLELKYLPVIESALNPNAVSHVGATGLWQFMLATGKRYGLEVNSLVDDRRDPIKSSWAAARYLRDLYNIYKDWSLVIAAYNCGPGNVNKAIHRSGEIYDYWQIYPYLPQETRGYVPAFIAANYAMNYYCEHGISPMQVSLPTSSDTIVISRDLHLQQVADLCRLPIEEVKALNPQYRTNIVPGSWRPSTLRLPQEAISVFIDYGDSIYNYRAQELLPRRSTVSVNEAYASQTRSSSSKSRKSARYATVRKGDSLGLIAQRNGTSVAALRRLNGIRGGYIHPGQKLRVR